MRILKTFALILSMAVTSCNGQSKNAVETIPADVFAHKIKTTPEAQLLDVRTPGEFSGEHILNAVNVDWNGDDFTEKVSKLDKTRPVLVYCKAGGRSAQAAEKLREMGFKEVYDLQGGIMKWNSAGLSKPVEKGIGMTSVDYKKLISSQPKVLVNVYAEWCAPCKKMAPYVLKLQKESKNVKIIRLNADEHKSLLSEMNIDTLPVVILYENGEETWRHNGFIPEDDLKKQLQ